MTQTLTLPATKPTAVFTSFYSLVAVAMLMTVIWGFSATYFAPLFGQGSAFGGRITDLPVIVHLHGWSFFLWYAFLVVQTALIRRRSLRTHRQLGIASVLLVTVMVITGFITITFNIHLTMENQGPPVWRLYGLAIFMTLVWFMVCYALAIRYRKDAQMHKRLMLLAGVPAISSALFRIFLATIGPNDWNIPVSMMLPALVIAVCMYHDRRVHGHVHKVHRVALPALLTVQTVAMWVPRHPSGPAILEVFGKIGESLGVFYG